MKIPGPSDVFRAAGQGYDAIEQAIEMVPKAINLLGNAGDLLTRADDLIGRVGKLLDGVEETSARAGRLVDNLGTTMGALQPTLDRLQPILATLADTTSPEEVTALTHVVDLLPELANSLKNDVLPILSTLDTVSPDLRQLLMISHELSEMLSAIPGLGRAKRKFEEEQDLEQGHAGVGKI
ncbi:MAG: hypothetical protein M3Z00_13100 [Actinomycetota bacterium]|nr:hypothetical protein [Actinomycetota bacterium]